MKKLSNFNERLSELMQFKGIKSEELAKKIGVTGSVVRRWTYNDTDVQLANLIKLADFFNCSIEFLIGRTENMLDIVPKKSPPFNSHLYTVIKQSGKSTYSIRKNTKIKGYHLFKWKNGSDPKLSSLLELSNYLGYTIDYLVGRE